MYILYSTTLVSNITGLKAEGRFRGGNFEPKDILCSPSWIRTVNLAVNGH